MKGSIFESNIDEGLEEKIFTNFEGSTNEQDIKVSIIMPCYNKYELVSLSLHCLLKQSFNPSWFELILIDDCSDDQTPNIPNEIDPPFRFKYIRPAKNMGRSCARNLGLFHALGEVIIFLDAEMLTEPEFVENHYKHHAINQNVVVCGAMHNRRIYTYLMNPFDKQMLFPLITERAIDNNLFKYVSFPDWYGLKVLNEGVSHFGNDLTDFSLPYIAFLSGNVSVRKNQLEKTGFFDESFKGWGSEDWELGYRLYKNGARFILDPSTFCYHQEHPASLNNFPEAMENLCKFINKFPNIDVLGLALKYTSGLSFYQIHLVITEYNELCSKYPNEFQEFKETFKVLLLKAVENLKDRKLFATLYNKDKDKEFSDQELKKQLEDVKAERWDDLANAFEDLYY
ncbi:glycosyltransferase [Metabacillus sp. RGM 3146]|uniref:glycosyltransferase n=1 Tax=Metabacillus sp. RGM 3146 TaxID=3401092 RepID=UPI003B99B7CA